MTSSTSTSGSSKRPYPFDSDNVLERRAAFTPSFGSFSGYCLRQQDAAGGIDWMQTSGITIPDQNDVFACQNVETVLPNVCGVTQDLYLTRNTSEGPDNSTGCDITIHNKADSTLQSAGAFVQRDWAVLPCAQWPYPSRYLTLALDGTAIQLQPLRLFSDDQPTLDTSTRVFQHVASCDTNAAPWVTAATKRETPQLQSVGYASQTTDTQVGDSDCKIASQTTTQALVSIEEAANSTSNNHNGNSVCFGTICDISVQFLDGPCAGEKSQDARIFAIAKRGYCYAIQSEHDVDIAVIDVKTTKALQSLDEIGSVTYNAVGDFCDQDQYVKTRTNKGKRADRNLEINIYGPQAARGKVSKILSVARLYLQQPKCLEAGISVDNPHMITFPNLTIKPRWAQLPALSLTPERSSGVSSGGLAEVFEHLDQEGDLKLVDVDYRITTALLDYQRQGVDFLLQREATVPGSAFSLWKNIRTEPSDIRYQHRITGKCTSMPGDETCGGILADEMGLGKSVMMLSTILATLNQARAFESRGAARSLGKPPSKATLVVAPSALLLDGWMAEVRRHVGFDALRIHKYHGSGKETVINKLVDFEIVLTTYATIVSEFSRNSRLHSVSWFRIVLDEAHSIRNQSTKCFHAVASLSARSRWCLTGTPIQNKLEDLGALVRFLQIPFLSTSSAFRNCFVQPMEADNSPGFEKLRTLLKSICIRRTRDLLKFPKTQTVEYKSHLSAVERSHYLQICESYRQAIEDAVCGREPLEAYRTILQALLKLRMLCNHGTLQLYGATSVSDEADENLALLQEGPPSCVYCGGDVISDGAEEDLLVGRLSVCSHAVCRGCIGQYQGDLQRLREGFGVACPLCKVSLKDVVVSGGRAIADASQVSLRRDGVSTKLSKLLEDIKEHRFSDKCIIFSSWKKTLCIISALLSEHSVAFVQLDGSLSLSARHKVLSAFQQDTQKNVLLMTLGTGAVGLNLTVATRIHIVEPQWNPFIESQAIGRAVRLGQDKQVTIIRHVMLDTVEQYIQSRQSRKLQIAELGFYSGGKEPDDVKLKKLMDLRKSLGI